MSLRINMETAAASVCFLLLVYAQLVTACDVHAANQCESAYFLAIEGLTGPEAICPQIDGLETCLNTACNGPIGFYWHMFLDMERSAASCPGYQGDDCDWDEHYDCHMSYVNGQMEATHVKDLCPLIDVFETCMKNACNGHLKAYWKEHLNFGRDLFDCSGVGAVVSSPLLLMTTIVFFSISVLG